MLMFVHVFQHVTVYSSGNTQKEMVVEYRRRHIHHLWFHPVFLYIHTCHQYHVQFEFS